MQPLVGTPESPASSPNALQPVVSKQEGKLRKNKACKVTRNKKIKLSVGFGQKYLYEGIWRSDKDGLGETCLTLRGKMVILVSKIDKYQYLYIILVLKI